MAVHYLGDNGPDGMAIGTGATEKVGFHGTAPAAQVTLTALATAASAGAVRASVREIIALMQGNGLAG